MRIVSPDHCFAACWRSLLESPLLACASTQFRGRSMRLGLSPPRCWHFSNGILRDRQLPSRDLPSVNKHARHIARPMPACRNLRSLSSPSSTSETSAWTREKVYPSSLKNVSNMITRSLEMGVTSGWELHHATTPLPRMIW
jgi:hypothetical protein